MFRAITISLAVATACSAEPGEGNVPSATEAVAMEQLQPRKIKKAAGTASKSDEQSLARETNTQTKIPKSCVSGLCLGQPLTSLLERDWLRLTFGGDISQIGTGRAKSVEWTNLVGLPKEGIAFLASYADNQKATEKYADLMDPSILAIQLEDNKSKQAEARKYLADVSVVCSDTANVIGRLKAENGSDLNVVLGAIPDPTSDTQEFRIVSLMREYEFSSANNAQMENWENAIRERYPNASDRVSGACANNDMPCTYYGVEGRKGWLQLAWPGSKATNQEFIGFSGASSASDHPSCVLQNADSAEDISID